MGTAQSGQIVRRRYREQTQQVERRRYKKHTHTGRPAEVRASGPSGLPMLRTSERSTFRRCHWKWWMEFEECIKPTIDVPPLRFGTLIHEALAGYYKVGIRRGPRPADTFEVLYEADLTDAAGKTKHYSKPEIDQAWSKHRDLGLDMLTGYIDHYGKDDEWKVLATEYPFKTIVNHPIRKTPWFWYTGVVDGLWQSRSTSRIVLPDHKTAASITLQYLQMDDQATSYWTWGFDALVNARLIPATTKLDGMLFNFLRKSMEDPREKDAEGFARNKPKKQDYIDQLGSRPGFPRKATLKVMEEWAEARKLTVLGEVSKRQQSPRFVRVPIYRDFYEREGARQRVLMEMEDMSRIRYAKRRDGAPPPEAYKNPSQFTCNGCWLFDVCELHEIGQDWQEVKNLTTRTWDPYAAHEIREGR